MLFCVKEKREKGSTMGFWRCKGVVGVGRGLTTIFVLWGGIFIFVEGWYYFYCGGSVVFFLRVVYKVELVCFVLFVKGWERVCIFVVSDVVFRFESIIF